MTIRLELPFRPPYDWAAMIAFLAARAIPGVEQAETDVYRRSFALGNTCGVVEVRPADGRNVLLATASADRAGMADAIEVRLRRLFDLDADIQAIDAHLAADPLLAASVRERPGLRAPGAWDGFELVVRALLGQQVSVQAARTFAGRLAAAHGIRLNTEDGGGRPWLVFPAAETVGRADLSMIGLTAARSAALSGIARAVATDDGLLSPYPSLDDAIRRLTALPGVGPWTAQYIAMRALKEADAFPASDLGLLRAVTRDGRRPTAAALLAIAEAWRPWRAYAAFRLWTQDAGRGGLRTTT